MERTAVSVEPDPITHPIDDDASPTSEPSPQVKAMTGVWRRFEPGLLGEPVRFYYFHGNGLGLYRYGRVGQTYTNSFDYEVEGQKLVINFRKTGERYVIPFAVERDDADHPGRDWLILTEDPREQGATVRYFRTSQRRWSLTGRPVKEDEENPSHFGSSPAGHLWIDLKNYATGGQGFGFYQFRPAGIDGRGVGWFHRGDFNDWSTEAFTFQIVGDRLHLHFSLAGHPAVTPFQVETASDGSRSLLLTDDPRDFWHAHTYRDFGPSFGEIWTNLAIVATDLGLLEARQMRSPHNGTGSLSGL